MSLFCLRAAADAGEAASDREGLGKREGRKGGRGRGRTADRISARRLFLHHSAPAFSTSPSNSSLSPSSPVLERDVVEPEAREAGEASAWTARNRRREKSFFGTLNLVDVDIEEEDAFAAKRGPAASAEGAVHGRMRVVRRELQRLTGADRRRAGGASWRARYLFFFGLFFFFNGNGPSCYNERKNREKSNFHSSSRVGQRSRSRSSSHTLFARQPLCASPPPLQQPRAARRARRRARQFVCRRRRRRR